MAAVHLQGLGQALFGQSQVTLLRVDFAQVTYRMRQLQPVFTRAQQRYGSLVVSLGRRDIGALTSQFGEFTLHIGAFLVLIRTAPAGGLAHQPQRFRQISRATCGQPAAQQSSNLFGGSHVDQCKPPVRRLGG